MENNKRYVVFMGTIDKDEEVYFYDSESMAWDKTDELTKQYPKKLVGLVDIVRNKVLFQGVGNEV